MYPPLGVFGYGIIIVRQGVVRGCVKMAKPDIEKMKAERDVEGLIKALNDKYWVVREKAVLALGYIGYMGDPRAVKPLTRALRDKDYRVRGKAAEVLGEMVDASLIKSFIQALKDKEGSTSRFAKKALVKIGKPAVEPLIKALKDKYWAVREKAAWALGEIKGASAVGPLIWSLKDENLNVREAAAWALGEIRDDSAIKPLIQALKDDKDWYVRQAAAWALGWIGDTRAVGPLIKALDDRDKDVREAAKEALKKLKKKNKG
jgi:HEAT repeat protein